MKQSYDNKENEEIENVDVKEVENKSFFKQNQVFRITFKKWFKRPIHITATDVWGDKNFDYWTFVQELDDKKDIADTIFTIRKSDVFSIERLY